jgi:MinD superfamily P-loop ATPase
MRGKIALVSYSGGVGRSTISGQLFHQARNNGVPAKLLGYDVEKQDWLSSKLLKDAIAEPVYSMVPSFDSARCDFCGNCLRFCSRFAIQFDRIKPQISLRPDRCHSCGDCMKGCHHEGISQQKQHIGNLYRSTDGLVIVGESANGARFFLPLLLELNQQHNNGGLIICDLPPGDSGFVSTSLIDASLTILIVAPSPDWEKQTQYMLDYLKSMKLNSCVLINNAGNDNTFTDTITEFCLGNNIPMIGVIPSLQPCPGIESHYDQPIIELFQNIFIEIEQKLG